MDDTIRVGPDITPEMDFSEAIPELVEDSSIPEYGVSESTFVLGAADNDTSRTSFVDIENEIVLEQDLENEISEEEFRTELEETTEIGIDEHLDNIEEKLDKVREMLEEEIQSQREMLDPGGIDDKQLKRLLFLMTMILMRDEEARKKDQEGFLKTVVFAIGALMREMFVPEEENREKFGRTSIFSKFYANTGSRVDLENVFQRRQSFRKFFS